MIGFEIYIGFNGQPKPIKNIEDLRSLYNILGLFLNSEEATSIPHSSQIRSSIETQSPQMAEPFELVPLRQPPGERAADYALKAAKEMNRPFTVREIANKMASLGWKSKSSSQRNILNSVRYAMKEAGFISLDNGYWQRKNEQFQSDNKTEEHLHEDNHNNRPFDEREE